MNVYVIASDGGMCKIGKGDDPAKRMASFYTGHPYKMRLVYQRAHNEPIMVESEAHRRLAGHRMSGEWFNIPYMKAIEIIEDVVRGWPKKDPIPQRISIPAPEISPAEDDEIFVMRNVWADRQPIFWAPCADDCPNCDDLGCELYGPPERGMVKMEAIRADRALDDL